MPLLFRLPAWHRAMPRMPMLCGTLVYSAFVYSALLYSTAEAAQGSPDTRGDWESHSWQVMGTQADLVFWPGNQPAAATVDAIRQEFERLNALLSPWVESSELYQANAHAADAPVAISAEFAQLIEASRHYSRLTDNAFDITFASVGHLYDYRAGVAPDDAALAHARAGQGMDR